jgi:hypothetical protein
MTSKTVHPELNAAELRAIASRLMHLAEDQENVLGDAGECETLFDDEFLSRLAQEEFELRRSRHCFLDDDLFGEPAWDILLELFIAKAGGKETMVKNCWLASGVPRSTALRYLAELEERSLVYKYGSETDGRVSCYMLTLSGEAQVRQALRHYAAIRLRREPRTGSNSVTMLKVVK